jgi:hypothetical protein
MAHLRVAGWASSGYCAVIHGVGAGMILCHRPFFLILYGWDYYLERATR